MGAPDFDLSVIVCSIGAVPVDATLRSVWSSAERAGASLDLIVVWQSPVDPPALESGGRLLACELTGLSVARNLGLGAARASLVAFVDDDEIVDGGWVAGILATFSSDPSAAAAFGALLPLDDEGRPHCEFTGDEVVTFRPRGLRPWRVGTGGNMVFRRDALRACGGFDPLLGAGAPGRAADETDVILRLARHGLRQVWTPAFVAYHPTLRSDELLDKKYSYAYGMGRMLRRNRSALLAMRYGVNIAQALVGAVRARDGHQGRSALSTAGGFIAGAGRRS